MKIMDVYRKNKATFFLYVLLIIIVIILAGIVLMPSVFYDQWIWKYYWGPVVADASGGIAVYNGVEAREGYTILSEITYAIILVIALYAIYRLLKRLKITVDWRFTLALMPYILFGPISRVLEDSEFFGEPFVYWYISPLIYLQITIYALFFLILGYYLEKKFRKPVLTVNNVLFIGGLIFLIFSSSISLPEA